MMRAALGTFVLGAAFVTSAARADDVVVHEFDPTTGVDAKEQSRDTGVLYLSPGPIVSLIGGRQPVVGIGGELSAMYFPRGTWQAPGYGAFVQAQAYDGKYGRFALGAQAAFANVGAELGLAYRQGDEGFVGTASVHGALFLSAGFLVITLRDTLPLNGFGDHLGFGSETAFTFSLKLPIIVAGRDRTGWGLFGNGY